MTLTERVLQKIEERRERILNGLINCIPLPFTRFKVWFPGVEKAKYYLVTANQKVGKSKFADKLFMYHPFFYFQQNPSKGSVKILYFTREMSKEDKMTEFLSHLLYKLSNGAVYISPVDLKSTREDKPVPKEILTLLKTPIYQHYITEFNNAVTFIDDIGNPTGVNKYCRDWAREHGHFEYIDRTVKDDVTGDTKVIQVIDRYIPNDPEQMVFVIFDNASNIIEESGLGKMGSIEKLSKYFVSLRNQIGLSPVLIQHQAQNQEGVENMKMNMVKPSAAGLADCKSTIRDINIAFGLYSPFKFGLHTYEGYDIDKFKNKIRFMEVLDDRDNGAGSLVCPLYFDGAVSDFQELPKADDKIGLTQFYDKIASTQQLFIIQKLKQFKTNFFNIFQNYG